LEKRVNRLLESVVQLRNANGQLMKENALLKKQLKEATDTPDSAPEEVHKLRGQYDQAMKDLTQVKHNLQRIETLADELKLEEH
jgi:regulator of replication initiation timing